MSNYKEEIINCLNLSDYCFEKDDETILKLLNENSSSHGISQVISGMIEPTKQVFTIAYREKQISIKDGEFENRNTYYICCKGTDIKCLNDILTDLNGIKEYRKEGTYHKGFHKRSKFFPLKKIYQWLNQGDNVILTGFSLGAAISQIITIDLLLSDELNINKFINNNQIMCITFGSPIIGGKDLLDSITEKYTTSTGINNVENIFHSFIHKDDPVPKLVGFGKYINDTAASLFKRSVSWFFDLDKSVVDEACNSISNYIPKYLKNKSSFIVDLDFTIGTYHILSNTFDETIQLCYLKDSERLMELLNFKKENLLLISSHKLDKYRNVLLGNGGLVNNNNKNNDKSIVSTISKEVTIFKSLLPIINHISIEFDGQGNQIMILGGENLCFISTTTMKFIYKQSNKEFNILSTSIIQKGYNQIIIDITNIPNNNTNNQLDSLVLNSTFKHQQLHKIDLNKIINKNQLDLLKD